MCLYVVFIYVENIFVCIYTVCVCMGLLWVPEEITY